MADYGVKMEIHIEANGKIFRLMDGEYIIVKKDLFSEECGQEINKMDSELKDGLEVVFFLENIIWEVETD